LAIAGYSGFTGKGFAPHVSELFHSIAPTMELRRKGIIFCIFLPGFIISFLLASAVALLFDVFTQQGRFSD